MKKSLLFMLLLCTLGLSVRANNLSITNVNMVGNTVNFVLSWDNSWNSTNNVDTLYPNNWDAVWVFVKVQSDATNLWSHLPLASSGHSVSGGSTPLTIEGQPDTVGVFIRRTNPGHGNISNANVTLNLGTFPSGTNFNIRVFGIEMVYVPSGNYYIGDGNASTGGTYFNQTLITPTTTLSASALFTGSPAIPATFPMAQNSFYAMKYEITQEQFADFLNTLTYDQQANFFVVAPNSPRETYVFGSATGGAGNSSRAFIRIDTSGINNTKPAVVGVNYDNIDPFNDLTDGLNVAQSNLSTERFLAYLDWAGLRPMTEIEYEKICRGTRLNGNPVASVLNEYAWGTTDIQTYTFNTFSDKNKPNERYVGTVVNGRTIAHHTALATFVGMVPSRVGVFAEGSTGRAASGAGFYGNMDLTGNVYEIVVGANPNGVTFTSQLGDGNLDINAWANQPTWPDPSSAGAYGLRGGGYNNPNTTGASAWNIVTRVSNRANIGTTGVYTGNPVNTGGRGVR